MPSPQPTLTKAAPERAVDPLRRLLARRDPAILGSILVLLALLALDSPQALASLRFTAETLLLLSPYLLGAFVLGAYLRASSVDLLVTSVFRGRTATVIVAASLFGALSPLCSCAVVPLIAVLLRTGMPLSGVLAFWIASPIISPGMYVLTGAVLGYEFASAKLLAAIAMGLSAGFATLAAERAGMFLNPLRDGSPVRRLPPGEPVSPAWRFWHDPQRRQTFRDEFINVATFLLKWMVLAFLLESVLIRYVPAQMIGEWVGTANAWAIPLATVFGAPAYLNGVAAVPLIGGLLSMGMTPGAAMGFLLAGSVTSVPAMAAVAALVRNGVFAWYVALGFASSLIAAFSFQLYLAF
jgi:uncharacterized protein